MKTNINKTKLSFGATLTLYLLIGFEFLYMASPFAAYFYSVYKPALNLLDNYPEISWLTGFFLPHLVKDTQSVVLNIIPTLGSFFAIAGLVFFGICASQVYYSKFFSKKVVTSGIYKIIRHPQYTAFAISSFGFLLLWPRYLALIMFITVLFGYYFLARTEEKECERKFGSSYRKYKQNVGMFFPRFFRIKAPVEFIRMPLFMKIILIIAIYFVVISVSVLSANKVKQYAVNNIYKIESKEVKYVSIFEQSNSELFQLAIAAENNLMVDSLLNSNKGKFLCYALPGEMYISEIPMQAPEVLHSHMSNVEYNHQHYKLVYTQPNSIIINGSIVTDLNTVLSLNPLFEVWINKSNLKITKIVELSGVQRYGNISEPVF